ncbi:hypothetical protein L7F22_064638 [Adiantum nelumboides]|nr:hypothetical protein [Adiantum nelumboides]
MTSWQAGSSRQRLVSVSPSSLFAFDYDHHPRDYQRHRGDNQRLLSLGRNDKGKAAAKEPASLLEATAAGIPGTSSSFAPFDTVAKPSALVTGRPPARSSRGRRGRRGSGSGGCQEEEEEGQGEKDGRWARVASSSAPPWLRPVALGSLYCNSPGPGRPSFDGQRAVQENGGGPPGDSRRRRLLDLVARPPENIHPQCPSPWSAARIGASGRQPKRRQFTPSFDAGHDCRRAAARAGGARFAAPPSAASTWPEFAPFFAFSSVPFDPSVFADLALHPEQALPLHPHPNSSPNSPHAHHNSHNTITATNNSHLHHHHHHHLHRHQAHDDDLENALYSSAAAVPNPPPTRPPGEPLPAPVVLVNEYGEERGEFEDDYYSDEELDVHEAASLDGTRDGLGPLSNGTNGLVAPPSGGGEQTSTKKKNKKKKKKSGATDLAAAPPPPPPPPPLAPLLSPQSLANPKATIQNNAPTSNVNALHPASNNKHRTTSTAPPAPSSRAAGKQPMTFSSTAAGKAPAGGRHPTSANGIGHGHGHGHGHGAVAAATGGLGKRTASVAAAGHPGGPASVNGVGTGGVDRTQQQQQQQQPQQAPKIWSSSSAEEREKIKEFWLCLNDKERRSLLKVEKEAVLRRMKEQQKHLCSCRVCGRKRHAIEDELDVLYEAYYVELEQYASHQQQYAHSGGTIPPPPGPGPFPGSVALDSTGAVIGGNSLSRSSATARGATQTRGAGQPQPLAPTGKKVTSLPPDDDEGYDDEDLEDDEYEDDYDDEEDEEDDEDLDEPETKAGSGRRRPANATSKAHSSGDSFFNLGSSLTVKGGILTVADDLLRNDGQKFLEMMEQLAERRSIREDEVRAIVEAHELDEEFEDVDVDEEEEVDEEDEEGEEELVEEDDEVEDDEDPEARMEEGRRMFQIFAARMFEQRVLQAYREKLLRELEAEDQAEKEKEAKKQKENQKKKDKKKQAKQQKEEERLRLESEKAAEAAAAKEKLEKQREAELKRQEEVRLKREAEKRAQLEEKIRKDEEKRKRQEEERARDAERERKKREKDEKARLERERRAQAEEVAKRTKEQREAEAAERKAREETGKKAEEALASSSSSSPTSSSSPAHSAPSNKKIPTPPRPAAGAALSEANCRTMRRPIPMLCPPQAADRRFQLHHDHQRQQYRSLLLVTAATESLVSSPHCRLSSPSPSGAHSRVAPTGPTPRPHPPPGVARPTSGGSNGPAPLAATSLSSLPAPPQGLPPRPTTSLVGSAPSSSHGHGAPLSAPSSSSLPRPPLAAPGGAGISGLAAASAAPLSAGPHVSSTPSAVGLANGATTSPPTQSSLGPHPTAPGHQQHQQGLQQSSSTPPSSSPFAQPPQPQQQPPVGLASQQHMALPSPRYGSSQFGPPLRSPSASSVTAAAHGGPSPAYATYGPLGMPSMGNKAGVEALASASPGLSSATASLASLTWVP